MMVVKLDFIVRDEESELRAKRMIARNIETVKPLWGSVTRDCLRK